MSHTPLVSICVPAYKGAAFLEECLSSALAQTYGDFELLVVDDDSPDATLEIAQQYASHDARVRVVRNPNNLGLVGNWNECVRLSRGEWIKFLFQDDLLEPQCLEQMLAVARSSGRRLVSESEVTSSSPVSTRRSWLVSAPSGRYRRSLPASWARGRSRCAGSCWRLRGATSLRSPPPRWVNRGAFVDTARSTRT